jgi:uncharacterized protein YbaR (Trm112 family)
MNQQMPEPFVCPLTKTKLRREGDFLVSESGYKYPIKDGIPILLPAAAIRPTPPAAAASGNGSSPAPTPDRGNKPE